MTEPAPSQGAIWYAVLWNDRPWACRTDLVSALEFSNGDIDRVIPVVPKAALDAERARADAMREFISELREAVVCDEGFEESRLKYVREMLADFNKQSQPERSPR